MKLESHPEVDDIQAVCIRGWEFKLTRTEDIDLFKAMLATERDDWLK
jgi:hypothetical protein